MKPSDTPFPHLGLSMFSAEAERTSRHEVPAWCWEKIKHHREFDSDSQWQRSVGWYWEWKGENTQRTAGDSENDGLQPSDYWRPKGRGRTNRHGQSLWWWQPIGGNKIWPFDVLKPGSQSLIAWCSRRRRDGAVPVALRFGFEWCCLLCWSLEWLPPDEAITSRKLALRIH